ncbi:MAG: nucleotidyltransferase family protein [Methylovulum sp.]|nr:nucleotidyltransferase family protein [Methylovulum sp.]
MKAMILAAGRGERMRPLTDHTPKPLLPAGGKPLIEHTICQLVAAGFTDIVINYAHLGQQIADYLGNGQQLGATIQYSPEGEYGLETAGGIINALPLLDTETFLVVNADVATDFPFASLQSRHVDLAHLILVTNPEHHPAGDFSIDSAGYVIDGGTDTSTFSGIGLYSRALFANLPAGKTKLAPLLRQAMTGRRISGQKHTGFWMDIGTPQRLQALDFYYTQRSIDHA